MSLRIGRKNSTEDKNVRSSSHLINGSPQEVCYDKQLWQPRALQRHTLFLFMACFACLAILLAALYAVSETTQGLCAVDDQYYYLWTYGPTAVFTLAMVFWVTVEDRSKQLAPWILMRRGATPASRSILVDYISSWNVLALFRSLRHGCYLPALAITGTLLIQLMIVFSTGLLAIQEATRLASVPVSITQAFDANGVNSSDISSITDPMPWTTAFGARRLGLSYPFGTTAGHAYATFHIDGDTSPKTSLQAEVNVFTFDLICEAPQLFTTPEIVSHGTKYWTLATESCNMSIPVEGSIPCSDDPACRDFWYSACSEASTDVGTWYHYSWLPADSQRGKRAETSLQGKSEHSSKVLALICRPDYNITQGVVTYSRNFSSTNYAVDIQTSNSHGRTLSQLTANDLLLITAESMFWSTAGHVIDLPQDSEKWDDLDYLSGEVRTVMSAAAAQIARTHFVSSIVASNIGIKSFAQARLFVRLLSFALIESILVALTALTLGIAVFYTPCAVCPTDPRYIGSFAAILARSDGLAASLDELGDKDLSHLEQETVHNAYHTEEDYSSGTRLFRLIDVSEQRPLTQSPGKGAEEKDTQNRRTQIRWWRPFSVSKIAQILVIGLPLCFIIALELLFRDSQTSHPRGVAYVPKGDTYIRYTWLYIPALAMTTTELLFASLQFTMKIFQPYHALRKGGAVARASVLDNQRGLNAIRSLWQASTRQQIANTAMSVAAALAPFLTIVVSGLYTTVAINSETSTTLSQLDFWNLQPGMFSPDKPRSNITKDILPSLVLYGNLSYPLWTYDEYTFPALTVNSVEAKAVSPGSTLSVTVPTLRAVFNCTGIAHSSLSLVNNASLGGLWEIRLKDIDHQVCDNNPLLLGSASDEVYYTEDQIYSNWVVEQCPSFRYAIGMFNATGDLKTFNFAACYPYLEQVDVAVTFTLPNFTIDTTQPPKPLASSSKVFLTAITESNGRRRPISPFNFDYDYLPGSLDFEPQVGPGSLGTALVHSVYGTPLTDLLEDDDGASLAKALNRVFGIFMAQLLGAYGRSTSPTASSFPNRLPNFNATITDPGRLRLVQSRISTRILQSFLGAMALCAIVTLFAMETKSILPKNPCSIAALASLLAGSEFLKNIPSGTEWADEKQMLKIFDGWLFSMGWWERHGEYRFGIDVGQAPRQDLEDLH